MVPKQCCRASARRTRDLAFGITLTKEQRDHITTNRQRFASLSRATDDVVERAASVREGEHLRAPQHSVSLSRWSLLPLTSLIAAIGYECAHMSIQGDASKHAGLGSAFYTGMKWFSRLVRFCAHSATWDRVRVVFSLSITLRADVNQRFSGSP